MIQNILDQFQGGKTQYGYRKRETGRTQVQVAAAGKIYLQHVRSGAALLLDMPLWVYDLFGLHGGELLGNDLQRHSLDLPGLWGYPQLWK